MVSPTTALDVPPPPTTPKPRVVGVDLVRGLVMVLMVLDHTRDYFADTSFDPTDLSRATPALFLTRWITHFCAPTFALLAGAGARLAGFRWQAPGTLARFLLSRGLWLIFLELTVVQFGILFRFNPNSPLCLVLWSLGGSFVLLSAFVALPLPAWVVGVSGLVIIAGHNLLDLVPLGSVGALQPLVSLLLRPGVAALPGGVTALVGYPVLPWFGVVAVGYWLGGVYGHGVGAQRRRKGLTVIGLAAIGLFVALRATGVYGDPRQWSPGSGPLTTVLSFVNCTKYPPSLQFLLMTLGPTLLALAAFEQGTGAIGQPLVTVGRVPLFFYVLQWYVIHGLALTVAHARGEPTGWLFVDALPLNPPPSSTFGLASVYGWWLVVLAILYVPSAWYASVKRRHPRSAWLSYL